MPLNFSDREEDIIAPGGSFTGSRPPQIAAPKTPEKSDSLKDRFKANPMGMIGDVLGNFAAGARGDPLPTVERAERERKAELEERTLEQQQREFAFKQIEFVDRAFTGTADVMSKLDTNEKRTKYITGVVELLRRQGQEAAASALESLAPNPPDLEDVAGFSPFAQSLWAAGDQDRFYEYIADEDLRLEERNRGVILRGPDIREKAAAITGGENVDWNEFVKLNRQSDNPITPWDQRLAKHDPSLLQGIVRNIPQIGVEGTKFEIVHLLNPDGTVDSVDRNPETRELFDSDGNKVDRGDRPMIDNVSVQALNTENLTPSEAAELKDRQVNAALMIATTGDILGLLEQNPDINTWTGSLARFSENMLAEAKAISRSLGLSEEEQNLDVLDTGLYDWQALGIDNAVAQSAFVNLAYMTSLAFNQRVTDADFRNAMSQIGAANGNPATLAEVLTSNAIRIDRNFRIEHKQRLGEEFTGDLGIDPIKNFGQQQNTIDQEGDLADGPNGRVIEFRGGQWVDRQTGEPVR